MDLSELTMDALPDAPSFHPPGLPSIVCRTFGADAGLPPLTLRQDAMDPVPQTELHTRLLFNLLTVEVCERRMYAVPQEDVDAVAVCSDVELGVRVRELDRAQREAEDGDDAESNHMTPNEDMILQARAYLIGHTPDGRKVGLCVRHMPTCEVELPDGPSDGVERWFERDVIPALSRSLRIPPTSIGVRFHFAARFLGYVPSPDNPLERKRFLFARLSFPNTRCMQRAAGLLRNDHDRSIRTRDRSVLPPFRVYEDGIDHVQKFIDQHGLQPCGWHELVFPRPQATRSSRELLVDLEFELGSASWLKHVAPGTTPVSCPGFDVSTVPPLSIAVVDCEMDSGSAKRMPRATCASNPVIAISVVFAYAGTVPARLAAAGVGEYQEYERRVYVLAPACDPIPGVIVLLYDDEFEMIAAVRDELFVHKKVDVVAGHNLIRFDMEYMANRVHLFGSPPSKRFMRFGVLLMEALSLEAKDLNSSAFGSNRLAKLNGAGFVYVDTLLICKQAHKLRQNTLQAAAKHFLGGASKFDMPYDLIPTVAASDNSRWWSMLSAYCVQDSVLVLRLLAKWDTIKDLAAQSRIMNIPAAANVQSGQQAKVRNYIMKDSRLPQFDMVMSGVNVRGGPRGPLADSVSALGGWVMDSIPGLHDKPVMVLDFASLYPSVQMMKNLCWSTVDLGDIRPEHEAAGLQVETHVTATGTFRFVKNVPGVFPQSLKTLKVRRSEYKKVMEQHAYGTAGYQNADNAQKAIKIPMNSGYGTANCEYGIMPCKAVGTATCHWGRLLNQTAEKFCKETFGTVTLYGDTDSIMIYLPEPPEVLAGTRKQRLQYAITMGQMIEHRVNEFLKAKFDTVYVEMELEKVYFPALFTEGKKTYAGIEWAPVLKKLDSLTDDLQPLVPGTKAGRLACKGIRTVRRDVPQFVSKMTEDMLEALFYKRDLDLFWDICHTQGELIVSGTMPVDAFVITAELKTGYGDKAVLTAQAAVSYAREYSVRGSGFQDGDRVPFVFVEESDPVRMTRPSWLDGDLTKAHKMASKRGRDFDDDSESSDDTADALDGGCAVPKQSHAAYVSLDDDSMDCKKAKHARHPDEVRSAPGTNHIDVVHYIDCICAVLHQLMPSEKGAQADLRRFALAHKQYNQRARGSDGRGLDRFFGSGASSAGLVELSHRRPVAPTITMTRTLTGGTRQVETKAKKATGRKMPAAAGPGPAGQSSLRSVFASAR